LRGELVPRLVARQVRQACQAPRHAPFDAPQRDAHRGYLGAGGQQALGQVVDRTQVQGAHRGELVTVLASAMTAGVAG